ncbi:MAG: adenosine-specific kinase [Candidatus Parvarchaeota archaeon]
MQISVENKMNYNVILGQSHFIKTVEDIYEAIVTASADIRFGIAFNEASGDRLIRYDGNDKAAIDMAVEVAKEVGAGHMFCIVLSKGYPINILNRIKGLQEVVNLYIATSNPFSVLVVKDKNNDRGIIGVIDGKPPKGIETEKDKEKRHKFLRDIGYKR